MNTMNRTLIYSAGVLALASATWSFAAGNFWPGALAVAAAGVLIIGTLKKGKS